MRKLLVGDVIKEDALYVVHNSKRGYYDTNYTQAVMVFGDFSPTLSHITVRDKSIAPKGVSVYMHRMCEEHYGISELYEVTEEEKLKILTINELVE